MTYPSPLLEQHEDAGATVIPYGPPDNAILLAETFGELDFEYAALRKGCVLIDWPHRATLEITGEDRISFLNNMVTQELKGIEPLESRRSFWLSRKGRVVSDLRITELGSKLRVDVDAHAAASTIETLDAYIITEDVEIKDVTHRVHRLSLQGPTGPELVEAVRTDKVGAEDRTDLMSLAPNRACWVEIEGAQVLVERQDQTGEIGLDLSVDTEAVKRVYNALVRAGSPQTESPTDLAKRVKLREAGWLAFNTARIEAGTPVFNVDFGTDTLPAETGEATLHDRVNFKKGCYLGQEVVARMFSLGKPKQLLVGLRLRGDNRMTPEGFARQPVGGAPISAGDAQVGVVTSSTVSPMLGGEIASIAMVRTKYAEEGASVSVFAEGEQVEAAVQTDLRYYSKSEK